MTDYIAKNEAFKANHPKPPVLPLTQFYFDDGTREYEYFKTPPAVGAPLKCALRMAMVNTVTGERAVMVQLTETQIELMRHATQVTA